MKNVWIILLTMPFLAISQEIVQEQIELVNGEITLPGTLSYQTSEHRQPLAIFVHGSGQVNRDGNTEPFIKADYIKLLADSLNMKGIAFYRYDKRTSIKENFPKLSDIQFEDLVTDVKKIIGHFIDDSRFSGIHVIGHSQGSLVGMLASTDGTVKSYISLAGPASTIDKVLVAQISKQNKDLGEATRLHSEELTKTDTIQEVNPFLMALFAPQNQKFLKSWMFYNPSEEIKKLDEPILIINGESDLQVTVEDAKLLKGASPNAKLVIIPKMNHVLKTVNSLEENQKAYTNPDFPLSTELVIKISEFIRSHG